VTPTLDEYLTQTGAVLTGHFKLSSGLHSPNYVQCAKLLESPAAALAIGRELAGKLRDLTPQRIVAPALGGVIIGFTVAAALDVPMVFTERKEGAMTLRRGFALTPGERIVIVEDVVTTGKSTRETADVVREAGGEVVGFASVLNRSGKENPFDLPFVYLQRMELETYVEGECALCARGVALDAPGSRYTAR
jgi:orotate phosphoribosyltransferase